MNLIKNFIYRFIIPLFDFILSINRNTNTLDINEIKLKKIGILLQWGIGDSVIASKLIFLIKKKYPHAKIFIIGKEFNKDIYSYQFSNITFLDMIPPWTNKTNKYNFFSDKYFNYFKKLNKIKKIKFDLLISPRFDFRDNLQLLYLNSKIKYTYKNAGFRNLFHNSVEIEYVKFMNSNCYELIDNFSTFLLMNSYKFTNFKKKYHSAKTRKWLKDNNIINKNYILFHGGASDNFREFCVNCQEKFIKNYLQSKPLIIVDDGIFDNKKLFKFLSFHNINFYIWSGKFHDLLSLISNCYCFVGMESGPLHLACKYNVRTFGFFINENQIKNWSPPHSSGKFQFSYMHKSDCSFPKNYPKVKFNFYE